MYISRSYIKRIKIKRLKIVAIAGIAALLLLGGLVYSCTNKIIDIGSDNYEVKKGSLDIIVSSDGSLDMPNQFDLKFGTTGEVKDILVEEGDTVKEGALLAFLDNKDQINAIKTALFNFRYAINSVSANSGIEVISDTIGKIWDTSVIPPVIINDRNCDPFLFYNSTFPDLSAPLIIEEAQTDLQTFSDYFYAGQYADAGSKLAMTYFDVEVCEGIINSKIEASVLAGAKSNDVYNPEPRAGTEDDTDPKYLKALDSLRGYRESLLNISKLMMAGDYEQAAAALETARQQILIVYQVVENTVTLKGWNYFTFDDVPTSLNFLQSALRKLDYIESYTSSDNVSAQDLAQELYLAKQSLTMGSDVLKNQVLTYYWGSGLEWQKLQKYNLAVQSAEIALARAKQDIMNTVIIAPTRGTVVSVDLKKGYPLSAQTYSSSTAVKLVDTGKIKFSGLVDEIDILKVQRGQKARIAVDAVPDKEFSGTVKFISPFGAKSGNVIKFAVTIELDPTDIELRGGLNATADIEIYSARDVLLVPVSMIITTPKGSMVMVVNPDTGKAEPRPITIGKQNLQYAEVLQGLKEGDKLEAPDLNAMRNMGNGAPPTTTQGGFRSLR
jgi:multidrug efflux pump subunit AcrA (membrane-fusion protein)